MLERIALLMGTTVDALRDDTSTDAMTLLDYLRRHHWTAERPVSGHVYLIGYSSVLSLETDRVLESAVGCVLPGSFLQGYVNEATPWMLRYYASHKTLVYGSSLFPRDPAWQQDAQSLLWVRNATPEDRVQIATLSPLSVDPQQGTLLVAERAGTIFAFLQYHVSHNALQTAIITRLATVPNGRKKYGYPQALVASLQQQYQAVVVASMHGGRLSSDYHRMWRALGFNKMEPTTGKEGIVIAGQYVWSKEEERRQHLPHPSL